VELMLYLSLDLYLVNVMGNLEHFLSLIEVVDAFRITKM